jgi:hypothetical protein
VVKKVGNRVGIVKFNKFGSLMETVEYKEAKNILVKFKEGYLVKTSWQQFCIGKVKNPYDKSAYNIGFLGVGEYKVIENNGQTKQYSTWRGMLSRCYDEKVQEKQPTYKDCYVSEEWHNFQNFATWYDENHYKIEGERMALDKDILKKGNKLYSPETCVFVPQNINLLFVKADVTRGNLPIGVQFHKKNKKYTSACNDGNGKQIKLGYYKTLEEAFQVYKTYKEKLIKQIANKYRDDIPIKLYKAMYSYIVEVDD